VFAPLASCLRYLRRPKSEEGEGGLCRSELRRWPPASGVCVGQKGEEGEGGFSSVKRERQRQEIFWFSVKKVFCFSMWVQILYKQLYRCN
jgi:hypothetical protein